MRTPLFELSERYGRPLSKQPTADSDYGSKEKQIEVYVKYISLDKEQKDI